MTRTPASSSDQQVPRTQEVFISYSRKDKEFVRRLDEELKRRDREAWVDWEGIPPGDTWEKTIYGAIEATHTFIFVLTPDSIASDVCGKEIAHAAANNKRLVPIVHRDVAADRVPKSLGELNWIFCRASDDFEEATDTLISALDTDLKWVRSHTRLLTRSIEWDANSRNNSFVLRGEDLRSAERWLAEAGAQKDRQPTTLQTEYIIASRKAAVRRQRITLGAVSFGAVVAIVLAVIAFIQRGEARKNAGIAKINEGEAIRQKIAAEEALSRSHFDQGIKLVSNRQPGEALAHLARAVRLNGNPAAATRIASLLMDRVWAKPKLEQNQPDAEGAFYSPDGSRVFAVFRDGSAELRDGISSKPIGARMQFNKQGISTVLGEFSADSSRLLTIEEDYGRLWDAMTGQPVTQAFKISHQLGSHFSEDGRWCEVPDEAETHLRDARDGRELITIPARRGMFSQNGQRYAAVGKDDSVHVWDTATGIKIGGPIVLRGHGGWAISPDGTRLANSNETKIDIWNIHERGAQLAVQLQGKPGAPNSTGNEIKAIQFNADGRLLLALSQDGVQVFDTVSGKAQTELVSPSGEGIHTASFSPEGQRIVLAAWDGCISVWDVSTAQLVVQTFVSPDVANLPSIGDNRTALLVTSRDGAECHARFSRDGREIVTTSTDGTQRHAWNVVGASAIPLLLRGQGTAEHDFSLLTLDRQEKKLRIWDIRSAKILGESRYIYTPEDQMIEREGTFCAGGKRLLVSQNQQVQALEVEGAKELSRLPGGGFDVSDDGSKALTLLPKPTVWDVASGKKLFSLQPEAAAEVRAAALSKDGKLAATPLATGSIQIWNLTTQQMQTTSNLHTNLVSNLLFSPDGSKLISNTDFQTCQLWDTRTGAQIGEPINVSKEAASSPPDLVFNPRKPQVAIDSGTVVTLINTTTGMPMGLPLQHEDTPKVVFSPDGNLIATEDGYSCHIWDAATGSALIEPIKIRDGQFQSVTFSPDSKRIALAGFREHMAEADSDNNGMCMICDVATGAQLTDRYENAVGRGRYAHFSPDGRHFVQASDPSRVWDIAPPGEAPKWLASLAEAVAGYRIGEREVIEELPNAVGQLRKISESLTKLPADDPWAQIARWFLAEPAKRTVRPYSTTTVADYVTRRLETKSLATLEEAARVQPDHPQVRSRLGITYLQADALPVAARNSAADRQTLFATILDPASEEVWQARAEVLKALNRRSEAEEATAKGSAHQKPRR